MSDPKICRAFIMSACVAIEQFTMVTGDRILIWFLLTLGSINADWNPAYEVADDNQHMQDMIEALNVRVDEMQNKRDDKIEDLERMLKELMNQKPSRDKAPEEEDSLWGDRFVPVDDYDLRKNQPGDGQEDLTNSGRKSDKLPMEEVIQELQQSINRFENKFKEMDTQEKIWGDTLKGNIKVVEGRVNDIDLALHENNEKLSNLTQDFEEFRANFSHNRNTRDVANQYDIEMGTDSARRDTIMTSLITRVESLEKSVQRLVEYENRFTKLEEEIQNMKRKPKD